MIVHSVDANLPAQTSAYAAAQVAAQSVVDPSAPLLQPSLDTATERPLSMLVASNEPMAPVAATRTAGPLAAGVAPCSIRRSYADAGEWSTVIAECDGRLVTVGRPTPARFSVTTESSSRLLSVLLAALAALALLFAAQAFCGGKAAE